MLVTVATIHAALARRRRLLFLGCCLLLSLCVLLLSRMRVGENAAAMLPDKGRVASDFELLQRAPFAQRLAISLHDEAGVGPDALTDAAKDLARRLAALGEPLVTQAMAGPPRNAGPELMENFLLRLPCLANEADREAVLAMLHPKVVAEALRKDVLLLQSPQSFAMERFIRLDPLELRSLALAKLGAVNLLPRMRLHREAFLSQDKHDALVILATDVPLTDVTGAERLLAALDQTLASLPQGIRATVLGGHGYTKANAAAIKNDLARILTLSLLGLALLFSLMARTWRVLFVLLIPILAYLTGAAATAGTYPLVSGITLGFGGVLMGISVDFGLHVFLALRHEQGPPGAVLASVARPIGFAYLTTAAAFSIMLLSDLPGVRQLSVFSLAGLSMAFLAALFVLPHLPLGRSAPSQCDPLADPACKLRPLQPLTARWIVLAWIVFMLGCLWAGASLRLQGDLRKLALMPEPLVRAEEEFRRTWGDVRGQAMVFTHGQTLQEALEANQSVYGQLRLLLPEQGNREEGSRVLSLAPLLPPESLQEQRRVAWRTLWEQHLPRLETLLNLEASRFNFAKNAFDPFYDFLRAEAPLMTVADLRDMGLGPVVDMLAKGSADGFDTLTLLPDDPRLLEQTPPSWNDLESPVRLVSQTRFREAMEQALQRDFTRFLLFAGIAVLVLLLALFRTPGKALLAATPVFAALAALAGGMGLMGQGLNIYGVLAAVLAMGLCVDYGIFMALRGERDHSSSTDRAVLLSGLSTVIGFGALAAARHPALHSMGLAVLFALAGGLPTALLVTPALQKVFRR